MLDSFRLRFSPRGCRHYDVGLTKESSAARPASRSPSRSMGLHVTFMVSAVAATREAASYSGCGAAGVTARSTGHADDRMRLRAANWGQGFEA